MGDARVINSEIKECVESTPDAVCDGTNEDTVCLTAQAECTAAEGCRY